MVPAGRRNLARPVANTSPVANVRYDVSLLREDDLSSFGSGSHHQLYEKLGAHPLAVENTHGTYFAVWAPNASRVNVIGDFNNWNRTAHPLQVGPLPG